MDRSKFESRAYARYDDSVVYKIYDMFGGREPKYVTLGKIINFDFDNIHVNVILNDSCLDKYILQNNTINKACKKIRVINVFRHELIDITKYFIIKDIILRALNEHSKNKVYARKTIIKEINNIELKEFLNKYHLQGYTKSSINIGLFNNNNELISVMTFGKPRMNRKYQYELIRLASKVDVVGGTQKMFKYFIEKYNPESIISYCDITKFSGNIYIKLGFKTSSKDLTSPNYVWVNADTNIVLPRYQTMKHKLIDKGIGSIEQTEDEIMYSQGFYKLYNSGNLKFYWYKEKGNQNE